MIFLNRHCQCHFRLLPVLRVGLVLWWALHALNLEAQYAPSLTVTEGDSTIALNIKSLQVQARIIGNAATTTMEMTFANHLDRDVQGKLKFPLPEGCTVSRYALEINGKMREGVVVEKAKGREAYESIVRQAIDPGLLEMTDGNVFSTSIYPIPANGTKRILIAYEQPLRYSDGDDFYICPLYFQDQVDKFLFEAIAEDQPFAPVMQQHPLGAGRFVRKGNAYRMTRTAQNYIPNAPITLICPVNRQEAQLFLEEKDGKTWFYLRNFTGHAPIAKRLPRTICLAWDVSRSGEFRDHVAELALLDRYFAEVGNFRLKLLTFSHAVHSTKSYDIKNGIWANAREFLQNQTYDGATQLGVLNLNAWQADEILLLTDGLSTFGASATGVPVVPVYIIHSAPAADHAPLRYLAAQTQGAYINLRESSSEAAWQLLSMMPYRFISGKFRKGRILETYPKLPTACPESFSLAGTLEGRGSKIELRFGYGNAVVDKVKYEIRRPEEGGSTDGVQRLWAQKKLSELRMLESENEAEITDLGMEHGLVTPYTSLIVLDKVEDYVNFEIEPPAELLAEYDSLLLVKKEYEVRQELSVAAQEVERLEDILDDFLDVVEWWEKDLQPEEEDKSGWLMPGKDSWRIRGGGMPPGMVEMPASRVAEDSIRKIRGKIIDAETGDPLPGVVLKLENSNSGCFTDMDGDFVLVVFKKDVKLTLAYLGYATQELDVREFGTDVVFEMEPAKLELSEVVVTRSLRNLVGVQVTSMNMNVPAASAGALVAPPSDALIILDGVAQDTVPLLDSALIVSQEFILTDQAIARYGARAANGLWVISTRNGSTVDAVEFLALPAWDSNMVYIDSLAATPRWNRYARYLELRETYGVSPAFFLDVADYFLENGLQAEGLRVLTNLAELDLGNHEVLRTLAFYLQRMNEGKAAVAVLRKVKKMRPGEPQSYRDLALALQDIGEYQEALDLLDALLRKDWSAVDDLFWGIQNVALMEMNALIANSPVDLDLSNIDERLIRPLPVRLRVVVDWNRLDTDIDLIVLDPKGEEASYSNRETEIGGYLSEDMVDGYGPETFLLKEAAPGEYTVAVDYYDEADYNVTGQTFLKITVFTDYGTAQQHRRIYTHRLSGEGEDQEIVRFRVD